MNQQTPYTLPLADPLATDLAITGGKGASLAKMALAKIPVPDGFHVTTAAYDHFVADNHLKPKILQALTSVNPDDPVTLTIAENAIRPLFLAGTIPDALADAVVQRYRPGEAMAVRSSATAEDLPEASFAGQQETYLNIKGVPDLLEAIKQCWSSLWTARAISYRNRQGISPDEVSLAVVIQHMVPAEVSGILFTANPLNGRRDEVLINASWGLGEAIVGGQVMPDQWIVNSDSGTPVAAEIAKKEIMTVFTPTGTENVAVPKYRQEKPVLNAADLKQLHALAQRISQIYDMPQDVEWVYIDGSFFIVQSRPITGLYPLPEPLPAPEDGLRVYMCLNVAAQGITEPLTPMGLEMFRLLYVGMTAAATGKPADKYPSWAKLAAGRMYLDLTSALRKPGRWTTVAGNLGRKDPVAGELLLQVLENNRDEIVGRPGFRLPWRLVLKIFPGLLANSLIGYLNPVRARQKL
nr:PEP/pyruvate-binding domain-containing protein [Ardenticatenaceae bacterium]